MPKHGIMAGFSKPEEAEIEVAAKALMRVCDQSSGTDTFEATLARLLAGVGRKGMEEHLEGLSEQEDFEEDGATWRVALHGEKYFLTTFGWVPINRPLFRAVRNGPTRCLVSERAGLFLDEWTPRAAKIAALATGELSLGRAAQFIAAFGGMRPSKTLLGRVDMGLFQLWDSERETNEARLRALSPIPARTAFVVVSLDGVMVNMRGAHRTKERAQALAEGHSPKGTAGCKEAAVGVVSFYDKKGKRLATWRHGRMPETNKVTLKAWIRDEVSRIRRERPNIRVVAAADGYEPNWIFLKTLDPDIEVVDYFHVVEYISRWLGAANGPSSLDTQKKLKDVKRLLLEEKDGGRRAFAVVSNAVKAAGKKAAKKKRGFRPNYLELHKDRMNYALLREQKIPIGTGVTEGTCRHLVVERLRRSGMTWSPMGGQAILNIRSLVVSDRFDAGWQCLTEANRRRLQRISA